VNFFYKDGSIPLIHTTKNNLFKTKIVIGSMCHAMHNNEVRGNLFLCSCNHPRLNALKHKINITFKTNPFGSHGRIGEIKPYLHITSKMTPLMLLEFASTSTFSNVNKNETCFPILHHIYVDIARQ
jgi:hypothetical protein